LNHALATLEQSITSVGTRYEEDLAPAVHRVWRDELAAIAGDLRGWVRQMAETATGWTPRYFELAFGPPDDPEDRTRARSTGASSRLPSPPSGAPIRAGRPQWRPARRATRDVRRGRGLPRTWCRRS